MESGNACPVCGGPCKAFPDDTEYPDVYPLLPGGYPTVEDPETGRPVRVPDPPPPEPEPRRGRRIV